MWNDIRFGARMLVKTPAFTIITGLALALGIGASTTTFSVVNALLLKPWPYIQDQERVLYVSEYFPKISSDHDNGVAYPDYLDFKQQATTLEGFGTTSIATMILSDGEKPDRYLGAFITADAFSFLGVKPVLGRTFRAEEDRKDATPVALLGYEIWQNHFGSDANIIGRVVHDKRQARHCCRGDAERLAFSGGVRFVDAAANRRERESRAAILISNASPR